MIDIYMLLRVLWDRGGARLEVSDGSNHADADVRVTAMKDADPEIRREAARALGR